MVSPSLRFLLLSTILLAADMLRGASCFVRRSSRQKAPAAAANRHTLLSLLLPLSNAMPLSRLLLRPLSSSSTSSSSEGGSIELVAGLEVDLRSGGRGVLLERSKGGWWKVQLSGAAENNAVISVRSSNIQPREEDGSAGSGLDGIEGLEELALSPKAFVPRPRDRTSSTRGSKGSSPKAPQAVLSVPARAAAVAAAAAEPIPPFELRTLEPPQRHNDCSKWLLFSDLHVRSSSIDTCEEVLRVVHEEALKRNAGIVFLGDFWHIRGALNVELLNRVLRALEKWTCPVIMIPGNHDQVTLGGQVHSLEPLVYAFESDQVVMIDEAVVCLGALWVPYRRDHQLMRSILSAGRRRSEDASTPARERPSAVFCHADVRGALMNDGMRSREGMDVGDFPPHMPVYSGHFHKPHTVKKALSSLRYLGSPYQTSLSEAGQEKYLYCLERTLQASGSYSWAECERWPLDVGRKYFKASSVSDPVMGSARAGDRVVVPVLIGEDLQAERVVAELKSRGVEVEVRREANRRVMEGLAPSSSSSGASTGNSNSTIEGAALQSTARGAEAAPLGAPLAEIGPLTLFSQFMEHAEAMIVNSTTDGTYNSSSTNSSSGESIDARLSLHQRVRAEGRLTLERLSALGGSSDTSRVMELQLERISLHNFGPYGGNRVLYPLGRRGLTLIRGESSDGTGADSNGSGKTTLAMSVMWALTGSMDARLVADGRAVDVAYDGGSSRQGSVAEVVIEGSANSEPFRITRRRGARKNDLLFLLGERDLTMQSVKDTQQAIDDHLGIGNGLLQRCCFFGQHSHTLHSLLGLTDVKLKSELSYLVDTTLWQSALSDVRARDKADKARTLEIGVELRVRGEELSRARSSAEESSRALTAAEAELERARMGAEEAARQSRDMLVSRFGAENSTQLTERLTRMQREALALLRDSIDPLRNRKVDIIRAHAAALSGFDLEQASSREDGAGARAAIGAAATAKSTAASRLLQQQEQYAAQEATFRHLIRGMNTLLSGEYSEGGQSADAEAASATGGEEGGGSSLPSMDVAAALASADPAQLRGEHEASLARGAAAGVRLASAQAALLRLRENTQGHSHAPGDECPTCGQEMPVATRALREASLSTEIRAFGEEQLEAARVAEALRVRADVAARARACGEQLLQLDERIVEGRRECVALDAALLLGQREAGALERSLQQGAAQREELLMAHAEEEQRLGDELAAHEESLRSLHAEERDLRQRAEALLRAETAAAAASASAQAGVALLQERIRALQDAALTKAGPLLALQESVAKAMLERDAIVSRQAVLERLAECLGPRGIQHFIFSGVLGQLEGVANAYLEVLADGGVRLALQGEDEDRIVKAVLVRAATDGQFKERGLSQLSGGQWRRVSMALDLAFAEVVRRRGVLRCNVIVMDEVLTHLDASGREAVGTVLRAMVQGPSSSTTTAAAAGDGEDDEAAARPALPYELSQVLLGGGAYETVIVILQDLAATELEESFDHIDTVVKEGDTARVTVDGQWL